MGVIACVNTRSFEIHEGCHFPCHCVPGFASASASARASAVPRRIPGRPLLRWVEKTMSPNHAWPVTSRPAARLPTRHEHARPQYNEPAEKLLTVWQWQAGIGG